MQGWGIIASGSRESEYYQRLLGFHFWALALVSGPENYKPALTSGLNSQRYENRFSFLVEVESESNIFQLWRKKQEKKKQENVSKNKFSWFSILYFLRLILLINRATKTIFQGQREKKERKKEKLRNWKAKNPKNETKNISEIAYEKAAQGDIHHLRTLWDDNKRDKMISSRF